jgi:hypothetical protein
MYQLPVSSMAMGFLPGSIRLKADQSRAMNDETIPIVYINYNS